MATQWVAFRDTSAMLHAPLSSAPANGAGWRAMALPQYHSLEVLDSWVIDTAHKSEAALGISAVGDAVYVVAVAESAPPLRFVLGATALEPGHDIAMRAGLDLADLDGWVGRAAEGFAAWSTTAPERADPDAVSVLVRIPQADGAEAAEMLFELVGLRLPADEVVSMTSLQEDARRKLEEAPEPPQGRRRRRD
jgi:hypothetical protein